MSDEEIIAEGELLWVGIDLDKTIANNSNYPDYCLLEPMPGAKKALEEIKARGLKIIINTSRPWHDYRLIEDWLIKYKIPFKLIICGKPFLKFMIDDRNIEFDGDWDKVLNKIK